MSTITQLLPFIGYPRTLNALRIVNEKYLAAAQHPVPPREWSARAQYDARAPA